MKSNPGKAQVGVYCGTRVVLHETCAMEPEPYTAAPKHSTADSKWKHTDDDWVAIAQKPMKGPDALTKAGITCTYNPELDKANTCHQYQFGSTVTK